MDLSIFTSQFEQDTDQEEEEYGQEEEQYGQEEFHESHECDGALDPSKAKASKVEEHSGEEISEPGKTAVTREDHLLSNLDEEKNLGLMDLFAKRFTELPVVENEEDVEPIRGRNNRKWDFNNELDYGDAIWKAMTQPIKRAASDIKPKDGNANNVENKTSNETQNKATDNASDVSSCTEQKIMKHQRCNHKAAHLVSATRLVQNHNSHVLIDQQTSQEMKEFFFWPSLDPVTYDNTTTFHWSTQCRIVSKLGARLIMQNGIDHPQALHFLSLMYKTPKEIAPHSRIGYSMIEQAVYGFALRGRWNNEDNIAQILDVNNPDESVYRYADAGKRIWDKFIAVTKKLRDTHAIQKKNKRKREKENSDIDRSLQFTTAHDEENSTKETGLHENDQKDNFSSETNMKKERSLKHHTKKDFDDEEEESKSIQDDFYDATKIKNERNEMYDFDFAADFSDDESNHFVNISEKKKITMLDDVRRHIYMRGVIHHATLDINTIRLTLSALLSKLGEERAKLSQFKTLSKHSILEIDALNDEITNYVETCFEKIDMLPSFLVTSSKAIAAEILLSYVSNAGFGVTCGTSTVVEDGNEVSTESIADQMQQSSNIFRAVKKLQKCPSVYFTLGIAHIAANFGTMGARIIAQDSSWHGQKRRTPFDLMKRALEHAEDQRLLKRENDFEFYDEMDDEKGMDVDMSQEKDDVVQLSRIMDSFEKAISCFSTCLSNESDNINYNSWYLASLAGKMILSSGMIIGKKKKDSLLQYQINESRMIEKKFVEARTNVVRAFKEILKIVEKVTDKNSDGIGPTSQFHLAIASFLEWEDATCLIIDGFIQNTKALKDMRRMHAWHTIQWAFEERNSVAMSRIKDLQKAGEVSSEVIVALQATLLETNAGKREAWLDLINVLGPVGKSFDNNMLSQEKELDSHVERALCDRPTCAKCKFLVDGIHLDHQALDDRSNNAWWGAGRSWWEYYFFGPLLSNDRFLNPKRNTRQNFSTDLARLKRYLSADFLEMDLDFYSFRDLSGVGLNGMKEERADIDWMYDVEEDDDDNKDFDVDEEDDVMNEVLNNFSKRSVVESLEDGASNQKEPSHFTDGIFPININELNKSDEAYNLNGPKVSKSSDGKFFEMLGFKVVVASHLLGLENPYISGSIIWIAEIWCSYAGMNHDENYLRHQDSYQVLLWLVSLGLNVMKIIDMNVDGCVLVS